jgi:hypothetical protein
MIGKNAVKAQRYGKHQRGIFFRRELPQLEAAIDEARSIYSQLGATWHDQKKTIAFPNGASLKFRPLERDSDAEKYQGHEYTDVYFEELTNYPDPKPYFKLMATLRSSHGVPVQMHSTANPGGPGHQWVKDRFIDPCPDGMKIIKNEHGQERVFIPAKVQDNQILLRSDPGYVDRLRMSGSESLVKAWLEGDWNIVDGAFFDCWSSDLVLRPFAIPEHWTRFRAMDWGSAKPFSVGWWAVAMDDYIHQGQRIPRGALIKYREWYGAKAPDVGLKLTVEQVKEGIIERDKGEKISHGVADPAMWAEDGGPSMIERMAPLYWQRADNARVARQGHIGGWDQVRARMNDKMVYWFSTCTDSIRTIPVLQHDRHRPEDIDTESEDHAADEARYACMSRPYTGSVESKQPEPQDAWGRRRESGGNWKTL